MALARHHFLLTIDTIAYLRKLAGVSRLCVDISTTLHCHLQACKQISANNTVLRPLKRKQDGLLSRGLVVS
jgi:hypothetical protein